MIRPGAAMGLAWLPLLGRSWWVVCPGFAMLASRLTFERACADPYSLLATLTSTPATAWPLALLYLSAHAWLFVAYLVTATRTNALWPSVAQMRSVWGNGLFKILLMTIALAVEYLPVSLWRVLGARVFGCLS